MMISDCVDLIVNNSAFVILLFFLQLLNGGCPFLVGYIKDFNSFCWGFIACLCRVSVNPATDEEYLVSSGQIG